MTYGIEILNGSNKILIDTQYPNIQAVETSGPSTVSPGTYLYSGGVLFSDLVVARPIRASETLLKVALEQFTRTWVNSTFWNYPALGYAYYRLRENPGAPTNTGYGIVVFEADGVTPIFNSNSVDKHFEIVSVFNGVDFSQDPSQWPSLSWFYIPAGDIIDNYYVAVNNLNRLYATGDFSFNIETVAIYDYTNNRIGLGFTLNAGSSPYYQAPGILGKII